VAYFTRQQDLPLTSLWDSDDHYEDFGFSVIAECDGFDIYVWEAVYIFKGGPHRPRSQWLGDGVADHTMIVVAPTEWRGTGMHDNQYLRLGMSTSEYFAHDDLHVEETDDSVTWRVGDMTYVSELTTGRHRVFGTHGEVRYDLVFDQLPGTTTVPIFGELEEAAEVRAAGAYSYSRCTGTIAIDDRTFVVEDGQGLHEHIAFSECPTWDVAAIGPRRDLAGGGVYGSFRNDELVVQIHSETPSESTVVVAAGDETVVFTGDAVDLQRAADWVDPKNGVSVPCRWRIRCESADGHVDLDIDGYARGGWPWELKRSMLWQELILATARGTFTDRTGRTYVVDDVVCCMDHHRMLLTHHETLDGPDQSPTW
jgi:hypothetical protein